MNTRRTPEELFNAVAEARVPAGRRCDRERPTPRPTYEDTGREMAISQAALEFVRTYASGLGGPETPRLHTQRRALYRRLTEGLWERLHAANRAAWDELDAAERDQPERVIHLGNDTFFSARVTPSGYIEHEAPRGVDVRPLLNPEVWPEGFAAARRLKAARESVRYLRFDARESRADMLNRNAQRRLAHRTPDERAHYLSEA